MRPQLVQIDNGAQARVAQVKIFLKSLHHQRKDGIVGVACGRDDVVLLVGGGRSNANVRWHFEDCLTIGGGQNIEDTNGLPSSRNERYDAAILLVPLASGTSFGILSRN